MQDDLIFAALDQLGLRYALRQTPRGAWYASFRVVAPDSSETAITVLVEHGVCRFTVHRVVDAATPSPGGLDALRLGARLPLGAAYRSPDDGTLELATGLWLGPDAASRASASAMVGPMLDYLGAAARSFTGGEVPARPPLRQPPGGTAIVQRLIQLGHAVEMNDGAVGFTVAATPLVACRVVLAEAADGWIDGYALLRPPIHDNGSATFAATLQELQRWTTAGRFTLDGTGGLGAQVQTPNLGAPVEAALWSASQLAAMAMSALRHLPPEAR